jgi:hypothetical protein
MKGTGFVQNQDVDKAQLMARRIGRMDHEDIRMKSNGATAFSTAMQNWTVSGGLRRPVERAGVCKRSTLQPYCQRRMGWIW